MVFIALLRGINVGGNAMVSMAALKACFEQLGLTDVKTYINSGNVIFWASENDKQAITKRIEAALEQSFGHPIRALLKTHRELEHIVAALPNSWVNDKETKCDVMFLWDSIDKPGVLDALPMNPDVEDVRYQPGAVIWRVNRANATKSRMTKIVGTQLYKQMTIRNANTTRKLLTLASELDAKR